jgi:Protein of unknown function (DUF2442)
MYWDIIEVVPKDDQCLFVRFKDGVEGVVRLPVEQLTGALEPVRDPRFFAQVFIDEGAVAWPGAPTPQHDGRNAHPSNGPVVLAHPARPPPPKRLLHRPQA